MSDMQKMIIESATKMMEKYSTKDVINKAESGLWAGEELWNTLVESGMITVAIPEELGGNGGDLTDALSILHVAGKYSAPIPLAETYMANWLLSQIGERVTDEILTVYYPKDMLPFQFVKSGEGWIVSGTAKYVPWARFAQKLLVLGETSAGPVLSLIKLDKAEIIHGQNLAGEARDRVIFENVFLEECKLFSINLNEQMQNVLCHGALTRCVMMAGALESILHLTINHTSERSQFGRPIHRFQAIQQQLALLAGEVAAANVAAKCASESYYNSNFSKEIAFAKIRVNEAAGKVNQIAHQVLAAIGFTYEHSLHHSTRRLWSWRDEYGTESDWEQSVAEQLVKLQKNQLWSMITGEGNIRKRVAK
jgi:acyl-CoA dehydrogenase